jgi:hypothetical protein
MLKDLSRLASGYAYDKLVSPRKGERPAVRHLRNLAGIANELLGRPLRPSAEDGGAPTKPAPAAAAAKSAPAAPRHAPVIVYFDGRDHRTLARVEELLKGRGYVYQVLDVGADEAELSWVTTAAKTTELPLVFVAAAPLGGLEALVQANVSGELTRLVEGVAKPTA